MERADSNVVAILVGFIKRVRRVALVDPEEKIFRTRLVNSMFVVQLIEFIEREFSIRVADDDLKPENFESINAIADFVGRKIAQQAEVEGLLR